VPLLDKQTDKPIEELLEEDSPVEHGWLRSPASLELQAPLPAAYERERLAGGEPRDTSPRAAQAVEYRWRRPRPVGPEKGSEEQIERKHARLEDILQMTEEEEAGSFLQRTKPSWRGIPRWASVGCAELNRGPFAPQPPIARCGSAGR
jgi:hypothetical protein